MSPLINYFSNTNSSTYSYFWTALQAANLDSKALGNLIFPCPPLPLIPMIASFLQSLRIFLCSCTHYSPARCNCICHLAVRLVSEVLEPTAGYLNDTSLAITVFAPTNEAWLKRLPTLTRANGITVQELFSESKSAALQNMLQYHILNTVQKVWCRSCSSQPL